MSYKQTGQIHFFLEMLQKVKNLALYRDIQCGNRFIQNQQLRIQCDRPRDTDPLPLAAGKLVRIALQEITRHTGSLHQIKHALRNFIL